MIQSFVTRAAKLITLYLHRVRRSNRVLDVQSIKRLRLKARAHPPYKALSGNFRPAPFDLLEPEAMDAEMDMMAADSQIITSLLDQIYEAGRNRMLLNEIQLNQSRTRIKRITRDATFLTADQFIEGFTTELNLKEDINTSLSDADISEGNIKIPTRSEITQNQQEYVDDAVTVSVQPYAGVPDLRNQDPQIEGRRASIIDRSFDNGIVVTVNSFLTELIEVVVRANVNVQNVNTLTMYMDEPEKAQLLKVEINNVGNERVTIFQEVVKSDRIIAAFSPQDVRTIFVTISQKLPNYTVGGINGYVFNLRKIKLTNSNRKNSAVAVSNSIPLRGDTRLIALVSEEVIPPDTSIQYSISRDLDDDNSPVNFRQVQPTSREGENKKENFIPIGVRSVVQPITHDTERPNATDWRYIVPEKKYGGRLYPIMDLASQVENFETLQIVDTSLRLFRGLNDWSITREKIVNTDIHQRIPYVPTYNEADQNFAPQPIYIRFSEEITIRDSDRADLRYPPVRTQDHEILDTSFNRTDAVITNFNVNQGTSGTEVIVEGATVATGTRFNITYYTRLQDITDKKTKVILQGSRIYNEAGELRRGIDYDIVDTNDVKEIRFKRGGSYTGANLLADLTVETEDLEKALIFKTLLISTKNLNLIMGPFSKAEIERGNIHRINGQDVSTLTSFPITAGTYLIESTQVDPGVNQFTQRESTAFIRIPFEELEMRGFEDSLRAVPAYDLVINSANDDRQFALADGKIYLNRTPDYTIQRSSSSVGKYLKTTRVTENGEVIGVPEQFRLEFDFIDPAQGETRISVRVEMTNSNGILPASPELKRLGINEFNKNIFK